MIHQHEYPSSDDHVMTPNERAGIDSANARMGHCQRLVATPPPPPVDGKGQAMQDRAVLGAWVSAYETAAATNTSTAVYDRRLQDLRDLVREAALANPTGAGPHAQTLAIALRALPAIDDKLADGSSKYATPESWLTDFAQAVDALVASLTPQVRQGFRS